MMEVLRKEGWRQRKDIRKQFETQGPVIRLKMQIDYQCNNSENFLNCECCDFVCGWKGE